MRRWSLVLMNALVASLAAPAFAQFGPGAAPGAGAPTTQGQEKEEGPAEAAPEEKGESPALQPLPAWPQQKEKQLQFFQLNGYIRFRAYLFHNLNLGSFEGPAQAVSGPRSPFYIPISEFGSTGIANTGPLASCAQRLHQNCRVDDLTSADMR